MTRRVEGQHQATGWIDSEFLGHEASRNASKLVIDNIPTLLADVHANIRTGQVIDSRTKELFDPESVSIVDPKTGENVVLSQENIDEYLGHELELRHANGSATVFSIEDHTNWERPIGNEDYIKIRHARNGSNIAEQLEIRITTDVEIDKSVCFTTRATASEKAPPFKLKSLFGKLQDNDSPRALAERRLSNRANDQSNRFLDIVSAIIANPPSEKPRFHRDSSLYETPEYQA